MMPSNTIRIWSPAFKSGSSPLSTIFVVTENSSSIGIPLSKDSEHFTLIDFFFTSRTVASNILVLFPDLNSN